MSINSNNSGFNVKEGNHDKRPPTPVEKAVSENKDKVGGVLKKESK